MLEVAGLRVRIGRVEVLRNLSLTVADGRIVGLVGRNGAGKTTTMRAVMGLVRAMTGSVRLDGRDIMPLPPYERPALGIGYLPEDRRLISTLSVERNLLLPAEAGRDPAGRERLAQVLDLLPELREILQLLAQNLSGGQQKLVALGRSFMNGRRLLLLDEPFEGVSTALSRRLADAIRRYQELHRGLSVLVAESDIKRAAMLTDRAFVIERGEVIEEMGLADVHL